MKDTKVYVRHVSICMLAGMLLMALPRCMQAATILPAEVDSLLKVYEQAGHQQRLIVGRQLTDRCLADDPLAGEGLPALTEKTPRDTLDLLVLYAAERYYVLHSYFTEASALIDRILPLTAHGQVETRATLLCDRGYCLFKMGRNTEAINAEMEAERWALKHNLLQQRARAYNYLAIINISLGYTDEAKHFVSKALDTDRLTGSDVNTHNYLGIACEVYCVAKEPEKAIDYGRQAVEAARKIGYDEGVVNHLSQLSYAYNRKGDYEEALKMAREAVSTVERMAVVDRNLLAISLEYVAYNLLDMNRNAEAIPVIRRAIALQQEVGNTRSVCYDYKSLAEALEPGQPREALKALRRYSQMMDSLHYAQMHEVLGQANAQLHNDELTEANAKGRRRTGIIMLVSAVVGVLLVGVILTMGYVNRLRERTNQALRHLQTTREKFFANITHEFRTPLTVILGLSRQMQEPEPATDSRQAAGMIEVQGNRLIELVNQLLDITKLQTAAMAPAPTMCQDVVGHIEMIVEGFSELAMQKQVRLSYEPKESRLMMDYVPDYLHKLVSNLLSNALKFTGSEGSVLVATQLRTDKFCLDVSDTGCGIPEEQLPYIFDPFYQVAGNGQTNNGTGLGLSLVRQLVETVGGTIGVESTPGHGTTFRLQLPYSCSDAGVLARQPSSPSAIAQVAADAKQPELHDADSSDDAGVRVLVVEDNPAVAYYIGSILSARYDVFYAADGQEGVEKACQIVPDAVLTDLMMPGMDGVELCRRLRSHELTSHVPVVMITAKTAESDRLEGLKAGADAFLTKPFCAQELTIRVEKLLEQRRLLREKFSKLMGQSVPSKPQTEKMPAEEAGLPSQLDAQFMEKVDSLIVELMSRGEADLEHLTSKLCMHSSTFRRKIQALTGNPPAQYIMRRRMEHACRLLADYPNVTVTEVAFRCGFADAAHFNHAFRRIYGTTPLKYAKELKADI